MLESQRDEPGTQREYETIYILRPDSDADQVQSVNTRIRKVIEEAEGKLLRIENWGKRKLAYEIKKEHKGIYLYWRYLAKPLVITELERNLRMLDTVLRFLTVKIDEDIDPEARPTDVTEVVFSAASETRPDEEDYYLGRATPRGSGDDDDSDDSDNSDDKSEEDSEETSSESSAATSEADSDEASEAGEQTPEGTDEAEQSESADEAEQSESADEKNKEE